MEFSLFLEQFAYLVESPASVKKLRRLILNLAIRGKLLSQNSDELVTKISNHFGITENQQSEEFASDIEVKVPYELPSNWKWRKIVDIADVRGGKRLPQGHYLLDIPTPYIYIRVSDMKNGTIIRDDLKYISAETKKMIENYTISSEDLYISIAGTIGAVGFVPTEFDGMNLTENAAKLTLFPNNLFNIRYIFYALISDVLQSQFTEKYNQLAQPKLSLRSIRDSFIPIPPLIEQQHIVTKVDELMQLCDQLEEELTHREYLKEQSAKSTLYHLTTTSDKSEALNYWQYAEQHFHELFDRISTVEELRATILQLAVQGRLVPQNPDDEPAAELLKRIEAEKQRLIKLGEIRKSDSLPPIGEDEQSYELPLGWEWARFNNLIDPVYPISYGVLVPGPDVPNGVPFVRIADLAIQNPPKKPAKFISEDVEAQYKRTRLIGGEILMGVVGSIGKLGVAPPEWKGANIARAICRIIPTKYVSKEYILQLLQSQFMQLQFLGDTRTLAQPTLNVGLIRVALTPLPPLDEQYRIVAKLDELMRLCDQLEEEAEHSRVLSGQLFDSIIYHLFEA